MIPLLSEISTQKIKDMDALLPVILVVKKSCNLIRREHENNNRRTKNCNVFHFRPLPAKSNDKMLRKVKQKLNFGTFWALLPDFRTRIFLETPLLSICYVFRFLLMGCWAEFQKKLMNTFQ